MDETLVSRINMGGRPTLARWARRGFLGIVVGSLVLTSLFDRGSDGKARLTVFPAGLVLSDPYVWDGLVNSLCLAVSTAVFALVAGTPIGWVLWRWRPFAARVLLSGFSLLVIFPPICLAIGLKLLTPWPPAAVGRSVLLLSWVPGSGWIPLFWAETSWATAWVVGVAVASLRRIDPSWEDAARLAGAGPRQIASSLIWPQIRPELCRAASLIVLAVLFEPGGPLVLETRRTLAFQILDSAGRGDSVATCAILTGLGLCAWLLIQGVLRLVGGPIKPTAAVRHVPRFPQRPPTGRLLVLPLLIAALFLGWAPIAGLVSPLARSSTLRISETPTLLRDRLISGGWGPALGWTLGLALAATALTQVTMRLLDRVGQRPGRTAMRPRIPGDGMPPSFLCALLIFGIAGASSVLGLSDGIHRGLQSLPGGVSFEVWHATGFAPLLQIGALWLMLMLSSDESPWSLGSISRNREGDACHLATTSMRPRNIAYRGTWVRDFRLCAMLAGPALLFGTGGQTLANMLANHGVESPSMTSITVISLAFLEIFCRGRGSGISFVHNP